MWNRPYVQYCLEELKSDELLKKLVENLYETDCLPDFMSLMTQLSDGSLSPLNIAFLLALEQARWQSLKTTTQMRFRPGTKNSGLSFTDFSRAKVCASFGVQRIMAKSSATRHQRACMTPKSQKSTLQYQTSVTYGIRTDNLVASFNLAPSRNLSN